MRVSVALATYNGAKYIDQQLASIARQTRQPDELVVSDDGSTDETINLVRAFAKTVSFPVNILPKKERLGFADNFLHAAENCRCELIALCDQDDVWSLEKLELGVDRLVNDGSLLSMHTLTVTDETLSPTGFELKQGIFSDAVKPPLALNPFGTGWGNTMIFRRELVHLIPKKERPAQPNRRHQLLSHDTWIFALAAALGNVSQINLPLILYRQHGATATIEAKRVRRGVISRFLQVPLAEYQERQWFDSEMMALMGKIHLRGGLYAQEAKRAYAVFAHRCAVWEARMSTFVGNSIFTRYSAYRRHQKLAGSERHWFGSRMKDILLGITGVVRLAGKLHIN